jgi:hypothetical protein
MNVRRYLLPIIEKNKKQQDALDAYRMDEAHKAETKKSHVSVCCCKPRRALLIDRALCRVFAGKGAGLAG